MWAEYFHADERTDRRADMTKLIFSFHNFANVPKTSRHKRTMELIRCITDKTQVYYHTVIKYYTREIQ